ncbi:biotin/lipoyl-binding protein [Rosistilla oblonga]|uniref:biotin/lipoyl-binding protein n=1 Tax=Rosistilla oblonga TaxID=2527990 RepID=UPI003A96998D
MHDFKTTEDLLPHPHVERFFAQVDRICAAGDDAPPLFPDLIDRLIADGIVASAAFWCCELEQTTLSARSPDWQLPLPHPLPDLLSQTAVGAAASIALNAPDASETATVGQRIATVYRGGSEALLILDAMVQPAASPAALRQRQELLEGFAELAGNRWVRDRFEALSLRRDPRDPRQAMLDLVVDESKSIDEATRELANLLLNATDVDRVSLLQYQAGATRLLALAPAGKIDRKSVLVRQLTSLVTQVAAGDGTLAYSMGLPSDDAPQESLLQFIDEAESRQVEVQMDQSRLQANPTAIVLERFTVDPASMSRDRGLALQALPVLRHLVDQHDSGFRRLLNRVRHASPARNAAIASLVGVVMLLALLCIPSDFWIPVDGHLHPVASRGVFAPGEGVIDSLYVVDGAVVAEGDKLLSIRDPQLELRGSELDGQIATLKSQLASAQAARGQGVRDASRTRSGDLSAQEQDLEMQLAGLQRQRELVSKHRQQLDVASPLAGTVQRWDMERELRDRPVAHGQHLLDVIDADSAWELRLDVPDHLIGYVLAAPQDDPLPVEFRIRSAPQDVMPAVVRQIAESSQVDAQGQTSVLVAAAIGDDVLHDPRIGAGVVARIYCGRRSLAFVWFRELIEFCQRSFYF